MDLAILALLALTFFIGSLLPPFRLSNVEINGTERLNPAYVVEVLKAAMSGTRFGILPQSSFFYFDTERSSLSLRQALQQIVPLNELTVVKKFPKTVTVTLQEGKPAAVLQSGQTYYFLDSNGLITGQGTIEDAAQYPLLTEVNAIALASGENPIHQTVLASLSEIRSSLEKRNLGPITFATPELRCPFATTNEPAKPITITQVTEDEGGNANTNTPTTEQTITPPVLTETVCNLKDTLRSSTELTAITGEGWRILFDTAKPLGESLDALFLALENKLTDRASLHQVDLRFLPRLFYQ